MKKFILIALSGIFLLAFFLRVFYLPQKALLFMYDMARDAWVVQAILHGDLKILGPPASTPGIYHGVFYYYLLAPAYFIGHGSPVVAAAWLGLLNSLGIFIVYYFTKLLTKNTRASILASIIYAISFGLTQYATWLSNPSIAIWTVPLIYLGLWLWLSEKNKWGPVVCATGLGLSIQAEVFLGYHILPVIFWLAVERKIVRRKDFIVFIMTALLSLSSMILVELKFGFRGIKGIGSILFTEDVFVKFRSLGDFIILYLNQIGRLFSQTLFPSNVGYGGFFGILLIIWALKNWADMPGRKLLSWQLLLVSYALSHLLIVSMGGISTPFVTAGLEVSIVILAGIFLDKLFVKNRNIALTILVLILASNLLTIFKENKNGQTNFAIQKDMTLKNELAAIDYSYSVAAGKPFTLNTLTSPLWINLTWSYLYNWYGEKKYGYLPQWYGRNQVDLLGNNLGKTKEDTETYIFIIEPMQGIPEMYLNQEIGYEDSITKLVEEKDFGEIRLQVRSKIR